MKRRASSVARHRLLFDRLARRVVTGGGLAVILSILGIMVFLVAEALPLIGNASVSKPRVVTLSGQDGKQLPERSLEAITSDEYKTHIAALGRDGMLRVWKLGDPLQLVTTKDVVAGSSRPGLVGVRALGGGKAFAAATTHGHVIVVPMRWNIEFDAETRRIVTPVPGDAIQIPVDPTGKQLRCFGAIFGFEAESNLSVTVVAQQDNGRLVRVKHEREYNAMSEEWEDPEVTRSEGKPTTAGLAHMLLDQVDENLYAVTSDGRVAWWSIANGFETADPQLASSQTAGATALGFLFGDRAFVVGSRDGRVDIWFPVRQPDEGFVLTRVRQMSPMSGALDLVAHTTRNKAFLCTDRNGGLGYYYSTTGQQRWSSKSMIGVPTAIAFTPKVDGFVVAAGDRLALYELDDQHPESSIGSFFSKIFYESYEKPEFVWQSTGDDEFESKLSLVPLVFGTLKSTIFSMLISIPIAVLGAMFVSQFMHHDLRKYIKPAIEIMAAMPSVILGFVAAVWLAPKLEVGFTAFLLMPVVLPLTIIAGGWVGTKLPREFRHRFPMGTEAFVFCGVLVLGILICWWLNKPVENALFGGDFPGWVVTTLGLAYEQRNAVVIAMAMSFAVLPIIFSISEEAFSNVPRSLVSGSLALGANRWQTVTRVVLPTASPGIFSATMVGFGRAVGETMIVLMATGNTAIMEWNPFNGFRTLSANIAVEIPEAPEGATLYRTLFLAALLLFAFTFLINTVAEIIRHRLRTRYSGAS